MTKKLFAPMRARRADTIRAKLAQLSLSEKNISEAITWVRQCNAQTKTASSQGLPKVQK